jgi:hypothetical protein
MGAQAWRCSLFGAYLKSPFAFLSSSLLTHFNPMSLLDDSFYGPAIRKWVATEGGCEECKTAIKARAGEIKPTSWFETKDFDTWSYGDNEYILPASATVKTYLDAFRSSRFVGIEGGRQKCMTYLIDAAALPHATANIINRGEIDVDWMENKIIEIILARVAPNIPPGNFLQRVPDNLNGTNAIDWEGIQYLQTTRGLIPLVARDGHPNCPRWSNWFI